MLYETKRKKYSNSDIVFDDNNLTGELIIPSNVTYIGGGAFSKNCNLKKIIIKKPNANGLTLGKEWNYNSEKECGYGSKNPDIVYNPN